MGDLANMTNVHGEVNGHRLLRWLRSRAQMEHEAAERHVMMDNDPGADMSVARRNLLADMADDLERELTPPDYPADDGDERSAFMSGPHDPCKRSPGADDDGVDLDDLATKDGP